MRVGCIIQARLGGTRLPGKILADIGGWPMIRHVYERMLGVGIPVVIACPDGEEMEIYQATNRQALVQGTPHDPNDVLSRYLLVAQRQGFDGVMRVTGDCPLIDPDECSRVLRIFHSGHYSYVANDYWKSYPDGFGCEMFSRTTLADSARWVKPGNNTDREHVTPWIKRGVNLGGGRRYCGLNLCCPFPGLEDLKFSVDTQEDLERVRAIDSKLPEGHTKYFLETTLEAWNTVSALDELVKEAQELDMGYGPSDKSQ